jgi:cerevisin
MSRLAGLPLALAAVSVVVAAPLSTDPLVGPQQATTAQMQLAPVLTPPTPALINDSYIVMFKRNVDTQMMLSHLNFLEGAHTDDPLTGDDSGLRHVYDSSKTKGYAGSFTQQTIERIRAQPEVDYIEQDQVVHTFGHETQRNAPWGLARVSHRPKLRFATVSKYEYDTRGGEGVDVYIIDTGININHVEFEGRATWGKTIPKNDVDEDGNGHGTHCAGTIGSRRYGVAKAAHLIAVKVLGSNGSGSMSDVLGGVVWASEQAKSKAAKARAEFAETGYTAHKGSVANMSLGGGKSQALDDAVDAAVDAGVHFAVAAGNDNRDACNYSPARALKAVTVGASTIGDERAYFSNWGACVDVFAPGLSILSTWTGSPTATNVISGTSMASPHTAGLLAYLLSIYPSESFDPETNSFDLSKRFPLSSSVTSADLTFAPIFASVRRLLAIFSKDGAKRADEITYTPNEDVTPIPKTLSPKQLKEALLALASPNMLSDLPKDTPNLLIFNNATAAY